MKTLNLSIELSSFVLNSAGNQLEPDDWLERIKAILNRRIELLGNFVQVKRVSRKKLGKNMSTERYELNYEKHSLQFDFTYFSPRKTWSVQDFSLQ